MRELSSSEVDAVSGAKKGAENVAGFGLSMQGVALAGLSMSEFGPLEWAITGLALAGLYFAGGGRIP